MLRICLNLLLIFGNLKPVEVKENGFNEFPPGASGFQPSTLIPSRNNPSSIALGKTSHSTSQGLFTVLNLMPNIRKIKVIMA